MNEIKTYENVLIRASAGTGKTYQLANRYLGLIARGERVDTILASTFTRKAAGEILNRILLRMAEAATDNEKREKLAKTTGMNLTAKNCHDMLRKMVRNLHRIHVYTLDGFFNHLATCFPYELGLAPGWRIMDDAENEFFVQDAVRQILADNPEDAVRLMRGLTLGSTQRSVQRQIHDLLSEMYEKTLSAPPEAWQKVEKIPLPPIQEDSELAGTLEKLLKANDNFRWEHEKCATAVDKIIRLASEEDWRGLTDTTLVRNALEADKTSSPLKFNKREVPSEIARAVTQLAFHASGTLLRRIVQQTYATQKMLERFHEAYENLKQSAKVVRFADITHRLARFISEDTHPEMAWRLDTSVNHLLLDEFQDTSVDQWNILKPLGRRCTSPEPGRLRTFFCVGDMKQAIYAWRGGKAAIFNAVTKNLGGIQEIHMDTSYRSSQVVLDAVNRIFGNMREAIKEDYLSAWDKWAENYNPHLSADEKSNAPGYWEILASPDVPDLDETATSPETPDAEDESQGLSPKLEETLKFTAKQVKKLYDDTSAGVSIGILMRRRAPVTRMIALLRKLGIQASEEVGNPLTNSQAVRLVLSLMKLVDHPEDEVSHFHVANSPLAEYFPALRRVDFASESTESLRQSQLSDRKECLATLRRRLVTEGYGKVVEELAGVLKPFSPGMEARRLDQLVKLAAAYDSRKTLRPADFVRFVELTPLANPTDANVRVMTIHQAKGLQFEAVFLPDLDFMLPGSVTPNFVVGYPQGDEMAPPKLVTRYVPQPLRTLLSPDFQEAFAQENLQRVEEGLCTLYVAVTRAANALHIIIPPLVPSEKGKPAERAAAVSKILMRTLAGKRKALPEEVLACAGDPRWWEKIVKSTAPSSPEVSVTTELVSTRQESVEVQTLLFASPEDASAQTAGVMFSEATKHYAPLRKVETVEPIRFAPGREFGRGLRRRTPSQAEERTRIDLEKTMHFRASSATRGTVLHAWFEKIGWLEYCSPADDELWQVARQNGLDEDMIPRSLQEFHNAIKNEKIRAVLSWEKYLPWIRKRILDTGLLAPEQVPVTAIPADDANEYHWQVYCEKELAVRTEKEFLLGTIDRLVLLWGGDRVLWAECFDYKTSKRLPPEILEEKVAKHRLQLQDYREMLHRHYLLPKEQITAQLIFPMMGVVREV